MGENRIKIICDPYRQEIKYLWLDENGNWSEITEINKRSTLLGPAFTKGNISHVAIKLLNELKENWCNIPLTIVFEGTRDNYLDLKLVLETYFPDSDITLEEGRFHMKPAKEVKPEIDATYGRLNELFANYRSDEIKNLLDRYNDTVKTEIAICVIGLYSTGKSTFINSLIGAEVLPSNADPETAKIYEIKNATKAKVAFDYDNTRITVYCSKKRIDILPEGLADNAGLLKDLKKPFSENPAKNDAEMIYTVLECINKFARNEGCPPRDSVIGGTIYIDIPFNHSYLPDQYDYVIYDTPGSDSASHEDHFEILAESLNSRTSGLPIIVVTPNSMDKKSLNELLDLSEKYENALDASNTLIVVNEADSVGRDYFNDAKDGGRSKIREKFADNIFFVSSIVGIGGKKQLDDADMQWTNAGYEDTFVKNEQSFSDPSCKYYKKLYEFNILQQDFMEEVIRAADKATEKERIVWNSGVPGVELGISRFAEKFALYNKCVHAIEYLEKAITLLEAKVSEKEQSGKEIADEIAKATSEKEKSLLDDLDKESKKKRKELSNNFGDTLHRELGDSYRTEDKKAKRFEMIRKAHRECTGKNDFEKAGQFKQKIEKNLSEEYDQYYQKLKKVAEDVWEKDTNLFAKDLLRIVTERDDFTDSEKEQLRVNMTVEIKKIQSKFKTTGKGLIINEGKKFLWIHRDRIKDLDAAKAYNEILDNAIMNLNNSNIRQAQELWKNYADEVIKKCEKVIHSLNPVLRDLEAQKEVNQKQLTEYREQLEMIRGEKSKIDALLDFEEA